eukprot:SAG11_NODE_17987_length_503_cov_0.752475_1_plen_111_part_10
MFFNTCSRLRSWIALNQSGLVTPDRVVTGAIASRSCVTDRMLRAKLVARFPLSCRFSRRALHRFAVCPVVLQNTQYETPLCWPFENACGIVAGSTPNLILPFCPTRRLHVS